MISLLMGDLIYYIHIQVNPEYTKCEDQENPTELGPFEFPYQVP